MWARHGAFVDPGVAGADMQDGVQITWQGSFPESGNLYPFLALGGAVRAKAGQSVTSGTSTSVTGIGFQPNCVLFCYDRYAAPYSDNPGFIGDAVVGSFGAAAGGNQFSVGIYNSYISPQYYKRRTQNDAVFFYFDNAGYSAASLASFDADGFTLSNSGFSGAPFGFLALRLDTAPVVGLATQGAASLSAGFNTAGVLVMGAGNTALGTTQADTILQFGVAANSYLYPSSPWSSAYAMIEGALGSSRLLYRNLLTMNEAAGIVGEAVVSGWSSGVSLNWTTDDAVDRYFGYVLFPDTQIDSGLQPVALISPRATSHATSAPTYWTPSYPPYTEALRGIGYASSPTDSIFMSSWTSGFLDSSGFGNISEEVASGEATSTNFLNNYYQLTVEGLYQEGAGGALPILGVG